MKHISSLLLAALLALGACSRQQPAAPAGRPAPEERGDSTLYGLACEGSNDTILVFLADPYDGADPDTLSLLDATRRGRVFGNVRVGDKVAIMRSDSDATKVDQVIVTQDLLGQWCYRVKPTLRRALTTDSMGTARAGGLSADSLAVLLSQEREYGIMLKLDSVIYVTGTRPVDGDEDSPVAYPSVKRYRQWSVHNGHLLLAETMTDSLGRTTVAATDTADLVTLTADTLVLRFADGLRGYYRKAEARD